MKRIQALLCPVLLLALMLTGCGKSEFGVSENTGKTITITAKNAGKDGFLTTGSLEVADGEQIEIHAELTKGMVRIEVYGMPEEQSIDRLPEPDSEAILTADLRTTDSTSAAVPAGTYLLKAACLETASGSVTVEVNPIPLTAETLRQRSLVPAVSYHPGTAGCSLAEARTAAEILFFIADLKPQPAEEELHALMNDAFAQCSEEEQEWLRENLPGLIACVDSALADYSAVSGAFEDAGADSVMREALGKPAVSENWALVRPALESLPGIGT